MRKKNKVGEKSYQRIVCSKQRNKEIFVSYFVSDLKPL
jgi:hypothetical protein